MPRPENESIQIVILAAGRGTRMRSSRPKVLHRLAGRTLLDHVLDAAHAFLAARGGQSPLPVVVYGHGGDAVRARIGDERCRWAEQAEQKGTGHAVMQAMAQLDATGRVLVLCGDVPLLRAAHLQALAAAPGAVAVLTAELPDPDGYGRILRDADGGMRGIVEHGDATPAQRSIREINTGLMALPAARLGAWLDALATGNAQGEYYLTDVIGMAVAEGLPVSAVLAEAGHELLGVNDPLQLAAAERLFQRRSADDAMRRGLLLRDPARFDLRGELEFGADCEIDVGVVLEGRIRLGHGVSIGPHCVLCDVEVGDGSVVEPHSVLEGARLGAGCQVGPFARLRPGTVLDDGARIGNFVEAKAAHFGPGSKANHLSYLGDAEIGARVNIGAGVITCNYDGAHKHRTRIGDDAFIGSDCQLVAPVAVGAGATLGAGTTLTRDAPPGQLTLSRTRQSSVEHWQRPRKQASPGDPTGETAAEPASGAQSAPQGPAGTKGRPSG